MASTSLPHVETDTYIEQIQELGNKDTAPWAGLTVLRSFIENPRSYNRDSNILIVTIPGEKNNASEVAINNLKSPRDLLEQLSLTETSLDSQMIVVENLCPATLAVLGGYYNIDPQFFAEDVNALSWYRMFEPIPERLPSLPSTKEEEDFLSLRYVSTRKLNKEDNASISAHSVVLPKGENIRFSHTAGRMQPIPGRDVHGKKIQFPAMAFTRQSISVWRKEKTNCNGWIAIMLVNGPFEPHGRYGLGKAEYRNPNVRPRADEVFLRDETSQSFQQAFCNFLKQRCSRNQNYRKNCAVNLFLALFEGYRIIASEWLVVNEYVKRELVNIEWNLEKKESTFQELEQHLKELYRIRRRCNKDQELVMEAISQCENQGQKLWLSSQTKSNPNGDDTESSEKYAQNLEKDFKYVLNNMNITISRIEKDISYLMALVSINEGRQSLQENRGISFLTLVAMIFLPSQTVASVLGIQTKFGPGANDFWMLWAVALPITVLVIVAASLYPAASAKMKLLTDTCVRFIRGRQNSGRNSSSEPQNGDNEVVQDPALRIHEDIYGEV